MSQLIELDILLAEGSEAAQRDEQFRALGWHGLSAALHLLGRWRDVDASAVARSGGFESMNELISALGPAPPAVPRRGADSAPIGLPKPTPSAIDAELNRRVTCRNFAVDRPLGQDQLGALLWRSLGAQGSQPMPPDLQLLKKNVPSAGGLHPTEAYLLVQRVAGLAAGIYHYDALEHALRLIKPFEPEQLAAMACQALAGQAYFAAAPLLIALSFRFERLLWKYRNHSKAYRAALLDVGHVSMLLYAEANRQQLGAFVTSAINDVPIEDWLGLDPVREGVIAMFGCGPRRSEQTSVELDPLGMVWPQRRP